MPIVSTDILYMRSKSTAAADGEAAPNDLGKYMSSVAVVTAVAENLFAKVTAAEAAAGSKKYRAMFVKNNHGSLDLQSAVVFFTTNSPETHVHTELAASGSETTVDVHDNAAFPSQGAFFCEDEEIAYTGKSGTSPSCSFTGCTRGSNSTSKLIHHVGDPVEHNQMRLAVEDPASQPSGAIQFISDEDTDPLTISFTKPTSYATGLSIGNLGEGEKYGVWLRRKVPLGSWAVASIYVTVDAQGTTDA